MKINFTAIAFVFVLCVIGTSAAWAQQDDINRKKVTDLLTEAKEFMDSDRYEDANIVFRKMLALKTVIPDDVSYLFAETLFNINQYQNSQNLLNKYLTLTGVKGNYYEQALDLQNLLKTKLITNKECNLCNSFGYRLTACVQCHTSGVEMATCFYCRGRAITKCQSCAGEGVQIRVNVMGEHRYQTCANCDGKGVHTCPTCHGAKEIETDCQICFGAGKRSTSTICDHQTE